ncbi:MAG: hypothetical protein LBQ00_07840, partial [Syntrophobacterales bacterium]|nr:hypothetical protein [Syntrophobacterales bacterium]
VSIASRMCLSRVKAIIDQALIGKMSLCEPLIRFDAWGRVLSIFFRTCYNMAALAGLNNLF